MVVYWPNNTIVIIDNEDGTEDYDRGGIAMGDALGINLSIYGNGSTLTGIVTIDSSVDNIVYSKLAEVEVLVSPINTGYDLETYSRWLRVKWRRDAGTGNLTIKGCLKQNNVQN